MVAKTVICTKCKSDRVESFTKDKPREPEPMTMDQFVSNVGKMHCVPAVLYYTTMVLLCKDCGYRLEYTTSQ